LSCQGVPRRRADGEKLLLEQTALARALAHPLAEAGRAKIRLIHRGQEAADVSYDIDLKAAVEATHLSLPLLGLCEKLCEELTPHSLLVLTHLHLMFDVLARRERSA
jgi:hypothetical protein